MGVSAGGDQGGRGGKKKGGGMYRRPTTQSRAARLLEGLPAKVGLVGMLPPRPPPVDWRRLSMESGFPVWCGGEEVAMGGGGVCG